MKNYFIRTREWVLELLKKIDLLWFIANGVPGAIIYVSVVWVLTEYYSVYSLLAMTIGRVLNSIINFILHKQNVFHDKNPATMQVWPYIVVSCFLWLANYSSLAFLMVLVGIHFWAAQGLLIVPFSSLSRYCLKRWVFKQRQAI